MFLYLLFLRQRISFQWLLLLLKVIFKENSFLNSSHYGAHSQQLKRIRKAEKKLNNLIPFAQCSLFVPRIPSYQQNVHRKNYFFFLLLICFLCFMQQHFTNISLVLSDREFLLHFVRSISSFFFSSFQLIIQTQINFNKHRIIVQ